MVYDVFPQVIEKIFIDLDDTLADFVGQAVQLVGRSRPFTKKDKVKAWDFLCREETQSILWEKITAVGPEWWANLPKLPWADELWEAANKACENVAILTSPGRSSLGAAMAAHGKMLWSFKNFNDNVVFMAYKKHMCATPGSVLIDDWDKFTVPWNNAGGAAVLLRREWRNTGYYPEEIIAGLNMYSTIKDKKIMCSY